MFASKEDVANRLDKEEGDLGSSVDSLLEFATSAIVGEAGKDLEWADEESDPTGELKALTVMLVCRSMNNPGNLASHSETLGVHQHSETFRSAEEAGIWLTKREALTVRRIVNGSNTASVEMESEHLNEVWPWPPFDLERLEDTP